MTHLLSDFLSTKAVPSTEDGSSRMPIVELFYDPESRRLRYAALDVGGWFRTTEVLVSIDRFGQVQGEEWPVTMSRSEIEAAPRWNPDDGTDAGGLLQSLPPLVVGPFGSTYAPLMMAARIDEGTEGADETDEHGAGKAPAQDTAGRVTRMDRASLWIGREAFGGDGSLGKVADMSINDELVLVDAVLEDGGRLPLARLRNLPPQGHAVFDILRSNLS